MMSLSWKLALRNLWRNRRRTMSVVIAMVAGFVGLVLLSAYILRTERGLAAAAVYLNFKGQVSIYHEGGVDKFFSKPSRYQLTEEEKTKVEAILQKMASEPDSPLEFVGEFISGSGLLSLGKKSAPVLITGFEPEVYYRAYNHPTLQKWAKDWISGPKSNHDEFIGKPELISVTASLAELIGKREISLTQTESEREVQLAATSYAGDLNAVNALLGVTHSTGMAMAEDTSLLAPLKLLQNLYSTGGLHYIGVFLKPGASIRDAVKYLRKATEAEGLKLHIYPFYDEKVSYFYVGTMGFLYVMSSFFVVLILTAVVLSIINAILMGIVERSREIGTLRALGFQQNFIRGLFIREAVWMAFFSSLIGSVLAILIAGVVNALDIKFRPPGVAGSVQFMLAAEPFLILVVAVVILFIATMTAFLVVRNRVNLKIVDLLTETGS